ncbi:MAG: hypothetical protein RRZ64_03870 [Rikenellaceae bacterium]
MKYISFIRYGLIAISLIILFLFLGTMDQTTGVYPYIDLLLKWTYAILFIAVAVVVILPVFNMAKNPKGAGRTFIGIGILAVILGISYALSDGTTIVTPAATFDNVTELKLSDTGLFATYITTAIAIAAIVVGEVVKLIRK